MMNWIAILLIFLAMILLLFSQRKQRLIGFPDGRVIYQDTEEQITCDRPLFDPHLKLTGKPDYLVRHGSLIIPVEVKSSMSRNVPYESHIQQLMAYCLLVQSNYNQRPSYGLLHYPRRTITIDFTEERENDILALISEMHARRISDLLPRSHHSIQRCHACGYRRLCDQRL